MKPAHVNSLVLRHNEVNAIWMKLDVLARQMELAKESDKAQAVREAMAHIGSAQFKLLDIIQGERAQSGAV